MSDIYDVLTSQAPQQEDSFDKDAWAQKKKEERDSLYLQMDEQAGAVSSDSGKLMEYLDLQSRLELYSVGNCLLIAAQCPEAIQLKDFEGWKKAGANVQGGQKGIPILEPGEKYTRDDGTEGVSYNVKKVFDIMQVKGASRHPVHHDTRTLLRALVTNPPVPIVVVEQFTPSDKLAFYNPVDKEVLLRHGIESEEVMFSVLAEELAHASLDVPGKDYDRETASIPAQMAAYMLCARHGVDTGKEQFSFAALPESFQKGEAAETRGVLTSARKALCDLNDRMGKTLNPPAKAKNEPEAER